MTPPKIAVIEEPPAETITRLRQQLQEAERERDVLREEGGEWRDRNAEAEALLLAALHARDEALRQGDALQTSLLKAGRDVEAAHAAAAGYCRKVIQTREVARWLLAEWMEPEDVAEAIEAAEGRFGMLDWLREKEETHGAAGASETALERP